MKIGVPKEIKNHEYRVGLVPASVRELAARGHDLFVETGAGEGIGMSDADYEQAGATILPDAAAVFETAKMIVKVKEPQAVERAMATGPELSQPWRLLASKEALRAIVLEEEDQRNALVSIACLDPADTQPRVRLVHLELSKSKDDLWRINLPEAFLRENGQLDDADDGLDSDLLDAFPAKLAERHPPTPKGTAAEARQAVVETLEKGGLENLIGLIRLDGDPQTAREACIRAARLWWKFRAPSSFRHAVLLSSREDKNLAVASFQFFSTRNPERFDFNVLYFRKEPDGWFWIPEADPALDASLYEWTEPQAKSWRENWRDALLADSPELTKAPANEAPSEEEARQLMESWFETVRDGDLTAALRLTARLDLPDSGSMLLRNLGYELIAARRNPDTPKITHVQRGEGWAAVGAKLQDEDSASFPLYLIVATQAGPRLLLEADLSETGKRGPDFLNKATLRRLEGFSKRAAAHLNKLLVRHREAANSAGAP